MLGVVVLGARLLAAGADAGDWMLAWLLQTAFWWSVFLKRAQLVGYLSVVPAFDGSRAGRRLGGLLAFRALSNARREHDGALRGRALRSRVARSEGVRAAAREHVDARADPRAAQHDRDAADVVARDASLRTALDALTLGGEASHTPARPALTPAPRDRTPSAIPARTGDRDLHPACRARGRERCRDRADTDDVPAPRRQPPRGRARPRPPEPPAPAPARPPPARADALSAERAALAPRLAAARAARRTAAPTTRASAAASSSTRSAASSPSPPTIPAMPGGSASARRAAAPARRGPGRPRRQPAHHPRPAHGRPRRPARAAQRPAHAAAPERRVRRRRPPRWRAAARAAPRGARAPAPRARPPHVPVPMSWRALTAAAHPRRRG